MFHGLLGSIKWTSWVAVWGRVIASMDMLMNADLFNGSLGATRQLYNAFPSSFDQGIHQYSPSDHVRRRELSVAVVTVDLQAG